MGEGLILFPEGIKSPKKSPMVLRGVVLSFVILSGIYTCSVCYKQFGRQLSVFPMVTIQILNRKSCESSAGVDPFVHFPKPRTFSRGECSCNPVRYFAILSTQRSGSGWFETLLNSHVNISSNGEIFSVKPRRSNATTILRTLDRVYNLELRTSAAKNECTAAVGLKWMLNQGLMQHHDEILDYFKSRGVSLIFLFRRNLLRRMISIQANSYDQNVKPLNGTHKSHVHSTHEAEILARYKPRINTTTLVENLRQVEDLVAKSLQYFNTTRHVVFYYEDVMNNPTKLADIQHFLKVPQRQLISRQVKIHKGVLHSQIQNWDDVNNTLQGTPYQIFLEQ
ncbi:hypothetical protein M569_07926 [Genlisea aurea]|uniref:Sulfotransferase n=1 Tax=Genlisea aurea TaxID=192259 RepID=S8CPX6_9LAMI|nr:hypothetical protein M569_07926 [Genlisea aurea]